MSSKHKHNCLHIPCSSVFGTLFIRVGTYTQVLFNTIAKVQRRAARFFFTVITHPAKPGFLKRIDNLLWEQPTTRRTNRRLTILIKGINGHLYLPVGNPLSVQRQSRHLYIKTVNTIHTRKNCYKYLSYFFSQNSKILRQNFC